MLRKRRLNLAAFCALILCASILLAAPARADIRYAFSSNGGSFIYDSSSFVGVGSVPVSALRSFSGDFEDVFFGRSDITLVNRVCSVPGDCFDAAFNLAGIFQTLGDYVATDGATLAISEVSKGAPIPEPSSWALLALGFAGLAFARSRRIGTACGSAATMLIRRSAGIRPATFTQVPSCSVAQPSCFPRLLQRRLPASPQDNRPLACGCVEFR
jgi:hypothetical protein